MAGVYRRSSVYLATVVLAIGIVGNFSGCTDLFGGSSSTDSPIVPEEYTITFDSAGGTPVASITQEAGTAITPPDDPTRSGYFFVTWDPECPATMPAEDMTLVARWLHEALATTVYRELVPVPEGTFNQEGIGGSSFAHTISAFHIGKYQVTYELWHTVRQWGEDIGYVFATLAREGSEGTDGVEPTPDGKREPVTKVSWRDSIVWLNAYSEMAGLTPVYYTDGGYDTPMRDSNAANEVQTAAGSIDNPYVNWDANGYRLPTEGEWQYAASWRGNDNTDTGVIQFPEGSGNFWTPYNWASGATGAWDDGDANTEEVAWWYYGGGEGNTVKTQPVGIRNANQLGIHDMSGNVYEWAWDWWSEDYPGGPEVDYQGLATGSGRVLRGGCWKYEAEYLMVGFSYFSVPFVSTDYVGFRPARTP